MKQIGIALAIVGVVAGGVFAAWAQEETAEAQIDESHKAAVKEMFAATEMSDTFGKTMDSIMDMQMRQAPQMEEVRDVMRDFLQKYMSWEALENEMVMMYAEAFTESEIEKMTEFYMTPVGKKSLRLMPELMAKSGEIAQRRVQAHMPELTRAIQEKMMESQGQ